MKSTKSLAHDKHEIRIYSYGNCTDFLLVGIVFVFFFGYDYKNNNFVPSSGNRLMGYFFFIVTADTQEDV